MSAPVTKKADSFPVISKDYVFESVIGAGGFGSVYRVRHVPLDRTIAIKVLHRIVGDDQEPLHRFNREARILASIRNPYIASVYSSGITEDGRAFVAMEFVDGCNLDKYLADTDLTPPDFVRIFSQISKALSALHAQQIVHRDLKPSNIMICRESKNVKVLDFGLCKEILSQQQLTQEGQTMGTPAYMSPEQCLGDSLTPASDVYSLGCILYESLCNAPPFTGNQNHEVMAAQVALAPPKMVAAAGCSRHLVDQIAPLVMRTLDKDPQKRPTAQALRQQIEELDLGSAIIVSASPVVAPVRSKNLALPALLLACAALIVVALVWHYYIHAQSSGTSVEYIEYERDSGHELQALRLCEAARAADPQSIKYFLLNAELLARAGRWTKGTAMLRQAASDRVTWNCQDRLAMAHTMWRLYDVQGATDAWRQLVMAPETDPTTRARARLWSSVSASVAGKREDALYMANFIAPPAEAYFQIAAKALAERAADRFDLIEKLIKSDPSNPDWNYLYVWARYEQNDPYDYSLPEKANRALSLYPSYFVPRFMRAAYYTRQVFLNPQVPNASRKVAEAYKDAQFLCNMMSWDVASIGLLHDLEYLAFAKDPRFQDYSTRLGNIGYEVAVCRYPEALKLAEETLQKLNTEEDQRSALVRYVRMEAIAKTYLAIYGCKGKQAAEQFLATHFDKKSDLNIWPAPILAVLANRDPEAARLRAAYNWYPVRKLCEIEWHKIQRNRIAQELAAARDHRFKIALSDKAELSEIKKLRDSDALEQAILRCVEARRHYPESLDLALLHGELLARAGDESAAGELLLHESLRFSNPKQRVTIARDLTRLCLFQYSVPMFEKLIHDPAADSSTRACAAAWRAIVEAWGGRFEQGQAFLDSVKDVPQDQQLLFRIASAIVDRDRGRTKLVQELVRREPDNPDAYYLVIQQMWASRLESADPAYLTEADKCLALYPSYVDALALRAFVITKEARKHPNDAKTRAQLRRVRSDIALAASMRDLLPWYKDQEREVSRLLQE